MNNFMIRCSSCDKPIIVEMNLESVQCPYCGKNLDVKTERCVLIKEKQALTTERIRHLIQEHRYDEARVEAMNAASASEAKTLYHLLILECDLLRHHLFYFDDEVITLSVNHILKLEDYPAFPELEMKTIRQELLDALGVFYKTAFNHLNKFKSFIGERYDAIQRFIYVGKNCLALSKLGVKTDALAKECVKTIDDICHGKKGDVYNMPRDLFNEANDVCGTLSQSFCFECQLTLQSNPNLAKTSLKRRLVCPICESEIPSSITGEYLTCPTCRHRILREKAEQVASIEETMSYQDKLKIAINNDDLDSAQDNLEVLFRREPNNPEYALMALIVEKNDITPLHLKLDKFIRWLDIASKGQAEGLEAQLKDIAAYFDAIRSILLEYVDVPHGPNQSLIDALSHFIAQVNVK